MKVTHQSKEYGKAELLGPSSDGHDGRPLLVWRLLKNKKLQVTRDDGSTARKGGLVWQKIAEERVR